MKASRSKENGDGFTPSRTPTILDILSEETFDDLTRLAAQLCNVPIAFLHVIENEHHHLKSLIGLDEQTHRSDLLFFSQVISYADIFVVSDASTDERFSKSSLVVSSPHIRFCAGIPLNTTDGYRVGTLCVMGPSPKILTPDQIEALRTLAQQVARRFDLWIQLIKMKQRTDEGKLFRERLAAEHAITQALAHSTVFSDAVPKILRIVCENLGWTVGIFWRVSDQVDVLTCVEIWRAPSTNAAEFESASRETILEPDKGLPGQVWSRKASAWITDVSEAALLERASIAAKAGLQGAFAFPIRDRNRILGVMEFFCSERREPDDSLLEMMSNVGSQVGQFMERKRAEETLVQWAAIVESSEDAIIGKTLDGTITSWNMGAEKLFGYSAEEVLGQPISIIFPPERLNEFQEIQESIRRGEPVTHYETERVRKDGKRIDVSLTISPIRDSEGRIVGASSIKRDITERKRVEEALRRSEARFLRLAESHILGLIFWDVDGNITEANDAFLKMVGHTREDLISGRLRWRDMTPQEYRALDDQALQELTETGACTPFEKEYFRKDGSRIPILLGSVLLEDSRDRGVCFVLDVTDRKGIEKALRESEARKGAILESSLDCIITIDHEGKILEFNPAAENTFGYSRAEVLGREMAELIIPPSLRERHRAGLAHYLATRVAKVLYRRIEITAMRADGSEFPAELTITRIHLEGPPVFTGYVRDISERKRTEEERDHLLIQERIAHAQAEEARRQMAFLAEASTLLASSLDYEATLTRVVRLAVPYLADGCAVILEEDRTLRRLVVAATDPAKEELGRELIRRYPADLKGEHPLRRVLQTGEPVFIPQITDGMLASVEQNEEHLKIAQSLGLRSAIIVPLLARGRTFGAMSFVLTDRNRRYHPADLTLAEDLARRVSMAVDNARLYRAAQEEIKERKRAEDRLEFLASHDALTRLPNRMLFTDRLTHAIERARRYPKLIAVLFLDLDGFKGVNDSSGHAIGDRLLQETASRLIHSTRRSDTVARLGGDEFTLIITDLAEAQSVVKIVQSIVKALSEPFNLEGFLFSVTASVGISFYPLDGEDPEGLLQKADQAMYRAKKQGGNSFYFYSASDPS